MKKVPDVRVTIKLDPETKEDLVAFAGHLGLTMSRLIRMLIKQALRQRRIAVYTRAPYAEFYKQLIKHTDWED